MFVFPPSRLSALTLALLAAHATAEEVSEPVVQLEADQVTGRAQAHTEARGDVIITRETTEVRSEWAQYDAASEHLKAGDDVRMTREGDVLTGRNLDYFLGTRRGTLDTADYRAAQGLARADAVKLLFDGPDRYVLKQARFTTCPVDNDDWYLHAGTLSLDYTTNMGVARNSWVEFHGVPILYSPWINFPLSGNRQTGFLPPTFSFDNRSGADIQTPFYWNIAPNYDATFYPRYLAQRGAMFGAEFRYLQPGYSGEVRGEYINDQEADRSRYSLQLDHRQQLTDRLNMQARVQKVSDNDYFNDFGDQLAVSSQTNLPREVTFNYSGDGWYGLARWQRYQTLQSVTNPVDEPYARLPQLYYGSNPNWIPGAQISLTGELADFRHSTKADGRRVWANPTVAYPIQTQYSFVIPKVGMHATYYQLNEHGSQPADNVSRVLPIFSLDSGLIFEREDTWRGFAYTQTLEPRAYYVYIPYKDQSRLPNFDSALTDFSFAQIFSENQFSGNDRINDANQLTLALTSRLYDTETGEERLYGTVGQRFYFEDQRVTLDTPARPADVQQSDLLVSAGGRIWRDFIANYTLQYNLRDGATARTDANIGWHQPQQGRALNLRYVMNRNVSPSIEQFDLSAQWPLARNWYGVGRFNYSLKDDRSLEALAGLEYNDGCWAARLVAQRYITSNGDYTVSYFAMLELGGLVGLGSNPVDTLSQSIPGYTDIVAPSALTKP
ncbi:LPS-assembly protein LptD [Chitiniphilus purpureus]|uniref:LPS-assembly protein LptD n=1 Tax=Chitiniphilus purpureus TaxID=2981137 RepID=A0ABY6DL11_9NEIS|nr:LPS-assembly protein LptD [Chitiniphilus sp. CD1]UXY15027.1 LPS-assembly protein LptD [Chitiniphilus sp. CD1]